MEDIKYSLTNKNENIFNRLFRLKNLEPKNLILIIFLIVGLFFIWKLFSFLGPEQITTLKRDQTRSENLISIQQSLTNYYQKFQTYPRTLDPLQPNFINLVPFDPKTKLPYEYIQLNDGQNYQICQNYEKKSRACYTN